MCNEQYSESGAPIAPTRCKEYVALKEENARLRAQLEKADALADEVLSGCKGCVEKCHRCPFGEVRLKVNAYKEVG